MSRRERQAASARVPLRRLVILSSILSVVATVVAVGVLAVVLTRPSDQGAGSAGGDQGACRTITWSALPSVAALPSGWAITSTRFLVGFLTTTLSGPAPSGSTQGQAAFVSVSCYGSDAALAIARDHRAALGAGGTDVTFPQLGDASLAVSNSRTGSTIVYIRRGILVADVTAASSLDQTALLALAGAFDQAMTEALAASPSPSGSAGAAGSPAATASGATASSAATASVAPSPSAAPVSHVAPDLEALLPRTVSGTTLVSQSVRGTTALQNDATSQSLIASLGKLGKASADLEIAEARDPAGKLPLRIFAFRVTGVQASDLASAIVASWQANTALTPNRSDVTIAGHPLTKVAYSQGPADYVDQAGAVVFDVEATDEGLVSEVLTLLK